MLQVRSPHCRLSAPRRLLGRNARTHARAARSVGMAQAAAARKKQEVPSAWRTASRTHVTATGFTSTDRSVGCLYVLRRTVVSAALLSAALLSLLHCCPLHIVSAALLSAARCPPHCCPLHLGCFTFVCISSALRSFAFRPLYVVLNDVCCMLSLACCLLHVVCCM
jgi:hypothetical protein